MASYPRKYAVGAGADIYINIPKAGSANHAVAADWTVAAGDVKISIDGAAAANIATLPVAVAMGNSAIWKFVFSNAELTGAFINVTVSDSATKAVDDTGFSIETYGHASAAHAFDLDTASSAQTGDNFARLGAPAGASVSADVAAVKAETAAIVNDTDVIDDATSGLVKIAADVAAVLVDTGTTLDGRIPAALVGGRIDASVGAMAANVLTAAAIAADAITAAKVAADVHAEAADAVWDEAQAGHVAAGSMGEAVSVIDGNVDDIEALLALTDADVEAILALLDNARGEPAQGAPPVNPDMATKVDWLYKFLRNKITQTSTTLSVYNDAEAVVDHKSTVSDDGTTFTRGEIVSGP